MTDDRPRPSRGEDWSARSRRARTRLIRASVSGPFSRIRQGQPPCRVQRGERLDRASRCAPSGRRSLRRGRAGRGPSDASGSTRRPDEPTRPCGACREMLLALRGDMEVVLLCDGARSSAPASRVFSRRRPRSAEARMSAPFSAVRTILRKREGGVHSSR